jgi:hypothetical protein
VISWFQSLPYKFKLHRYTAANTMQASEPNSGLLSIGGGALYRSNPVDPQLESAWFQPFELEM